MWKFVLIITKNEEKSNTVHWIHAKSSKKEIDNVELCGYNTNINKNKHICGKEFHKKGGSL